MCREKEGKINVSALGGCVFDIISYCLGGSSPQAFLQSIGSELEGKNPKVSEDGETNIKGLFLVGDLVAKKGTIMGAFNSAKRTNGWNS